MELYKVFATDLMMLLNHPAQSKEHSTFFEKLRVKGGVLVIGWRVEFGMCLNEELTLTSLV